MILGRKERQIRCLHYCFVTISDWAIRRLKETRDDYVREHGRGNTPNYLLNVERDWEAEIDVLMNMMRKVGIDLSKDHHEFLRDYMYRY